jgi:hypothetical protein
MDKVETKVGTWTDGELHNTYATNLSANLATPRTAANQNARALFDATMKVFYETPAIQPFQKPTATGSLFPAGGGQMPKVPFLLGTQKIPPVPSYGESTGTQQISPWIQAGVRLVLGGAIAEGYRALSGAVPVAKFGLDVLNAMRGIAGVIPSYYGEWTRLSGEDLFELAKVNREIVTVIANRILMVGKALGIDTGRLTEVVELTANFAADFPYLVEAKAQNNWTEEQFKDAVMTVVSIYQNRLDQILGIQATSLNALDPGTRIGRYLNDFILLARAVSFGTYLEPLSTPDPRSPSFDNSVFSAATQGFFYGSGTPTASSGTANVRPLPKSKVLRGARVVGYAASSIGSTFKLGLDSWLAIQHPTPLATTLAIFNGLLDGLSIYANARAGYTEAETLMGGGTPHFRVLPYFAALSTIAMFFGAILTAIAQATDAQTSPTLPGSTPTPSATPPGVTPSPATPASTPSPTVTPAPTLTPAVTPTQTPAPHRQ